MSLSKRSIFLVTTVLALSTLVLFVYIFRGIVIGRIDSVYYQPNMAEDGQYLIFIKRGESNFLVDATGLINSPEQFDSRDCIDVPEPWQQRIENKFIIFSLPESKYDYSQPVTKKYSTCFMKEDPYASKYFLRIIR